MTEAHAGSAGSPGHRVLLASLVGTSLVLAPETVRADLSAVDRRAPAPPEVARI